MKAAKEKEMAAIVKRKKKVKKTRSKISSLNVRKTTIAANTAFGIQRGGLVGKARKKSLLL